MSEPVPTKKMRLRLIGLDGNAFALLAAFRAQARKEGWTAPEIDAVLTEATKADYSHLLVVLDAHFEEPQ
jgi:hypothetical protein